MEVPQGLQVHHGKHSKDSLCHLHILQKVKTFKNSKQPASAGCSEVLITHTCKCISTHAAEFTNGSITIKETVPHHLINIHETNVSLCTGTRYRHTVSGKTNLCSERIILSGLANLQYSASASASASSEGTHVLIFLVSVLFETSDLQPYALDH